MHDVDDPFKSVGRLLSIQSDLSGVGSWASLRAREEQIPGFSVYATPFLLAVSSCATSPITMTPEKAPGDNGSFTTSDQFRNNDFFRLNHGGGNINLELYYSKSASNSPDLDLYLYRPKYIFGRASDMLLSSAFVGDGCPASGAQSELANPFRGQNGCAIAPTEISPTFGYEKASVVLAAGTYMINVHADTTYTAGSATSYVLILNGQAVCPIP